MLVVIVRRDLPIAEALEGRHTDLRVGAAETNERVEELLPEGDALIINPSTWENNLLEGLSEGDWVQATSTGYAAFPVKEFRARGIMFTNATGNYGSPVADHAFALALGLARGISTFVDGQHRREWDRTQGGELIDLDGRTLTVVGMGDIGESVARRGQAFGMDVYGTKRNPDDYDGCLADNRVLASDELETVIAGTELLVLTVPLTDETHHLVNRKTFERLPDTALLVNVARGPVVDQEALIDALEAGRIAGAGLDVFDTEPLPEASPLWEFENVIATPHVGVDRGISSPGSSNCFSITTIDGDPTNHSKTGLPESDQRSDRLLRTHSDGVDDGVSGLPVSIRPASLHNDAYFEA